MDIPISSLLIVIIGSLASLGTLVASIIYTYLRKHKEAQNVKIELEINSQKIAIEASSLKEVEHILGVLLAEQKRLTGNINPDGIKVSAKVPRRSRRIKVHRSIDSSKVPKMESDVSKQVNVDTEIV